MAATTLTSTTIVPATVTLPCRNNNAAKRENNKVVYLTGVNSYGGLKAQNNVLGLGIPTSSEQCFAKIISSLRLNNKGRSSSGGGGGALSSTCNAAAEIFRIAAIMNGLVLVGVAVGFVLLRVEAWAEEAE